MGEKMMVNKQEVVEYVMQVDIELEASFLIWVMI